MYDIIIIILININLFCVIYYNFFFLIKKRRIIARTLNRWTVLNTICAAGRFVTGRRKRTRRVNLQTRLLINKLY